MENSNGDSEKPVFQTVQQEPTTRKSLRIKLKPKRKTTGHDDSDYEEENAKQKRKRQKSRMANMTPAEKHAFFKFQSRMRMRKYRERLSMVKKRSDEPDEAAKAQKREQWRMSKRQSRDKKKKAAMHTMEIKTETDLINVAVPERTPIRTVASQNTPILPGNPEMWTDVICNIVGSNEDRVICPSQATQTERTVLYNSAMADTDAAVDIIKQGISNIMRELRAKNPCMAGCLLGNMTISLDETPVEVVFDYKWDEVKISQNTNVSYPGAAPKEKVTKNVTKRVTKNVPRKTTEREASKSALVGRKKRVAKKASILDEATAPLIIQPEVMLMPVDTPAATSEFFQDVTSLELSDPFSIAGPQQIIQMPLKGHDIRVEVIQASTPSTRLEEDVQILALEEPNILENVGVK